MLEFSVFSKKNKNNPDEHPGLFTQKSDNKANTLKTGWTSVDLCSKVQMNWTILFLDQHR